MKTFILRIGFTLCVAIALVASTSFGQMRSGKFGVGVGGSLYLFNAHLSDNLLKAGGNVALSYSAMENLGLRASFGGGQLGWKDLSGASNTTTVLSGDVKVSYDILPNSSVNPFLYVGAGGMYFDPRSDVGGNDLGNGIQKFDIVYLGGAGVDFFFNEFLSLTLSGDFVQTNTKNLDVGMKTSPGAFSRVNLELRYYFFDQDFITKILKALQDRYEKKK